MATPMLVCVSCGASLSENDLYCSQCGTKVEHSARRCQVCGFENAPTRDLCESCGAKLSPAGNRRPVQQVTAERRAKKVRRSAPAKQKREPWQYVAGGAIIVLLGFFIYTELTRVGSSPSSPSPAPDQSPAMIADRINAIEQLQRTVNGNPQDAASTLHLANLLHDDGSRDPQSIVRAVEMYKKYLAMTPDNPDARVDLGVCLFELGRRDSTRSQEYYTSAAKEMETAYAAHPTHQTAAFNLGIVHLHAGNLDAASKWFKRAMEIDPNSTLGSRAKQLLEEHAVQAPSN